MPSTISAGTTAGTAIAIAGDTTGNLAFQTNGTTTAMTIDTSQNVGIGTSGPTQALDIVRGSGDPSVRIGSAGGACFFVNRSSGQVEIINAANQPMLFSTNNTERMRIDASGRMTVLSQPVFLASNNVTSYTGTTSSSPFAFNITTLNVGSNFNTSTYRFTAPIAGRYLFYFSLFFDASVGTSNCDTCFAVNGTILSGGVNTLLASRPGQDRITVGNTLVLNLNANDFVDVRGRDGTGTGNAIYGPHSYFGGYLVG